MYLCCESGTGYACKMELYTRKKTDSRKSHGSKVVKRMMDGLHGKGQTVFTNSFFTTVQLFYDLYQKGTNATGTIKKDQPGLPTQLRDVDLNKGEQVEYVREIENETGTLHAMQVHDKKVVTMISTSSTSKHIKTEFQDWQGNVIKRAEMTLEYNHNINAVHQFNQHLQSLMFVRKTWQWWMKLAMHLIHMAKVQAFIVYTINNPSGPCKLTQLEFTKLLIDKLTAGSTHSQIFKRRVMFDPPTRLRDKHFLSKVKPTASKKYPTRICVLCTEKGGEGGKFYSKRKEVRTECAKCDKGLCDNPCFKLYHTRIDPKRKSDYEEVGDD